MRVATVLLSTLLVRSSSAMWASPSKVADAERNAWLAAGGKQSEIDAQLARNQMRNISKPEYVFRLAKNSSGCGSRIPSGLSVGETKTMTLTRKDATRTFRVHLPTGFDNSHPTMLVLDFHGYYDTEISACVSPCSL